jgi:hypothetical protein
MAGSSRLEKAWGGGCLSPEKRRGAAPRPQAPSAGPPPASRRARLAARAVLILGKPLQS